MQFIAARPRGYVIIQAEAGVGKIDPGRASGRDPAVAVSLHPAARWPLAGGGAQEPGRAADRPVGPARVGAATAVLPVAVVAAGLVRQAAGGAAPQT